jgi:putative ABC transport system ATP-binding protein
VSTLALREVVKHYRSGSETVRAVDGVSLDVSRGELAALYGPSGSGKSTLLQLAAGLLVPDSGHVLFAGRSLAELTTNQRAVHLRREVGIVLQSFHLVEGASALENTALKLLADGLSLREAKREARPWLARVGLAARQEQPAAQLSTGERQRVAIARALVNEPQVLLADEPTGNLDSVRGCEILQLLSDISRERRVPTLLVTHDPHAVSFATSTYTLRDGRLNAGLDAELRAGIS